MGMNGESSSNFRWAGGAKAAVFYWQQVLMVKDVKDKEEWQQVPSALLLCCIAKISVLQSTLDGGARTPGVSGSLSVVSVDYATTCQKCLQIATT